MSKISDIFHKEQASIGHVLKKYLGTLVITFLLCLYLIIMDITNASWDKIEEYLMIFLGMSLVGFFFTESVLRGRKSNEITITAYILSLFAAFLWVILNVVTRSKESALAEYYYVVLAVFYALVLLGLSFIALVQDSKLPFEQYFTRMVFSAIRIGLILAVMNLGFLLLLYMIDALIVSLSIWEWLIRIELLLTPLVYAPYLLSCLTTRTEEQPSKFAKGIILYAMMPMYIAAVIIIFLYMVKILVTWDFPVNQVYMICASLFSVGVVIWTMAFAFTRRDPGTLYHILIRYMKYIVAPFILLEIYAIGIRIVEYGWTMPRVLGVYFIALQVVYTAWEPLVNMILLIFRKDRINYAERYEWMVYAFLATFFFAFILPWTSAEFTEDLSQEARFKRVIREITEMQELDRDWTPEEYQTMAKLQYEGKSIRSTLRSNIYGNVFLKANYTEKQLNSFFTMQDSPQTSTYDTNNDEWTYSQYYENGYPEGHLSVPISEYTYFYTVSSNYSFEDILTMEELKEIKLNYGMNQAVRVDIENVIQAMVVIDDGKMIDPTQLFAVKQKDGSLLIITDLSFRYADRSRKVRNLSVTGYLFVP